MNSQDRLRGLKKFYEIVDENKYLNIATSDKAGNAWISNLFYGFNKDLMEFYWGSPVNSRHSANIRENPHVAINIYNPTTFKEIDDPIYRDAVYLEGVAKECDEVEVKRYLPQYANILKEKGFIGSKNEFEEFAGSWKDYLGSSPLRFYMAKVERVWLLGAGEIFNGKFVDGRVKIDPLLSL
ncbi:MAG: hypothetical protein Fur003_5820 [Candidatus Dojkabacteria bacterium]